MIWIVDAASGGEVGVIGAPWTGLSSFNNEDDEFADASGTENFSKMVLRSSRLRVDYEWMIRT